MCTFIASSECAITTCTYVSITYNCFTVQMFDNIAKLKFVEGHNGEHNATAMISAEGEMMDFRTHVTAEGKVEDWMTDVLNEMRRTNRLITKESIFKYLDGMTRCVCTVHPYM